MKSVFFIIVVCLFCFAGYYFGRKSAKLTPGVTYVFGETIRDTIIKDSLIPYSVYVPAKTKYIEVYRDTGRIDTIKSYIETVKDWNLERSYFGTGFKNDTIGELSYQAKVKYNMMQSLSFEFKSKIRQINSNTERSTIPFITGCYNSIGIMSFGAGIKHKKIGYKIEYVKNTNTGKNGVGAGIIVFF